MRTRRGKKAEVSPVDEDSDAEGDLDMDLEESPAGDAAGILRAKRGARKGESAAQKKKRNADAQAAFRERRKGYIQRLERTIAVQQEGMKQMQLYCTAARDKMEVYEKELKTLKNLHDSLQLTVTNLTREKSVLFSSPCQECGAVRKKEEEEEVHKAAKMVLGLGGRMRKDFDHVGPNRLLEDVEEGETGHIKANSMQRVQSTSSFGHSHSSFLHNSGQGEDTPRDSSKDGDGTPDGGAPIVSASGIDPTAGSTTSYLRPHPPSSASSSTPAPTSAGSQPILTPFFHSHSGHGLAGQPQPQHPTIPHPQHPQHLSHGPHPLRHPQTLPHPTHPIQHPVGHPTHSHPHPQATFYGSIPSNPQNSNASFQSPPTMTGQMFQISNLSFMNMPPHPISNPPNVNRVSVKGGPDLAGPGEEEWLEMMRSLSSGPGTSKPPQPGPNFVQSSPQPPSPNLPSSQAQNHNNNSTARMQVRQQNHSQTSQLTQTQLSGNHPQASGSQSLFQLPNTPEELFSLFLQPSNNHSTSSGGTSGLTTGAKRSGPFDLTNLPVDVPEHITDSFWESARTVGGAPGRVGFEDKSRKCEEIEGVARNVVREWGEAQVGHHGEEVESAIG